MKRMTRLRIKLLAMWLLPASGFFALYVVPLLWTFRYSFASSAFDGGQAGFHNYTYVWTNEYFLLGLRNLLKTGLTCCLPAFALALLLSVLMIRHEAAAAFALVVLFLPLLIPSVCAAELWKEVYKIDVLTPPGTALMALFTLFLWKCTGPAAIVLYAALRKLEKEVLEAAMLDGCGEARLTFGMRLPMIRRECALSLVLLLLYHLRFYKDVYLLYGLYPPKEMYLVQHYMNNQYLKMNAQYVSAAGASLACLCLGLFILALLVTGRREKKC